MCGERQVSTDKLVSTLYPADSMLGQDKRMKTYKNTSEFLNHMGTREKVRGCNYQQLRSFSLFSLAQKFLPCPKHREMTSLSNPTAG